MRPVLVVPALQVGLWGLVPLLILIPPGEAGTPAGRAATCPRSEASTLPAYSAPKDRALGVLEVLLRDGNNNARSCVAVVVNGALAGHTSANGKLRIRLGEGAWAGDLREEHGFDFLAFEERQVAVRPGHTEVGPLTVWPATTATWALGPSGHALLQVVPDLPPQERFARAARSDVVVDLCSRRVGLRSAAGRLQAIWDLANQLPLAVGELDAQSPGLVAAVPLAQSPAADQPFHAGCRWSDSAPIGLPSGPTARPHRHVPRLVVECDGAVGHEMRPPSLQRRVNVSPRLAGTTWYADGQVASPVIVHVAEVTGARDLSRSSAEAPSGPQLYVLVFGSPVGYLDPSLVTPRRPAGCRR